MQLLRQNSVWMIPLEVQHVPFFLPLYLVGIGHGGHKPCLQTFGADQFDENSLEEKKTKSAFFSWWYFGMSIGSSTGMLIVFYVQENIGWVAGFAIPVVAMTMGLVMFLLGGRSYQQHIPSGSPLTRVMQVFVAAVCKRRVCVSKDGKKGGRRHLEATLIFWLVHAGATNLRYCSVGPFVFGMIILPGPLLGSTLVERFEFFNTWMVMPMFYTIHGMMIGIFAVKLTTALLVETIKAKEGKHCLRSSSMETIEYIVIVGAGIAGLTTALGLHRLKSRTGKMKAQINSLKKERQDSSGTVDAVEKVLSFCFFLIFRVFPCWYFADRDIFCAGRVTEEDLQRVAAASGGTVQTSVNNVIDAVLGTCELFEERQVGNERFNIFSGCPSGQTATIVLRGGADQFIEEAERSLHDAIMIVRRALKNSTVVAGGGAIDMEISKYLRKHSRTITGKSQIFINAYAKAFEVIPRQLCDNAGFDATDVLNKLRQKHALESGEGALYGVDINTGGIIDTFANFVWEPAVVKINAINAATEAACLILSVDETVKNPKSESAQGEAAAGAMGRGRGGPGFRGRGRGMRRR